MKHSSLRKVEYIRNCLFVISNLEQLCDLGYLDLLVIRARCSASHCTVEISDIVESQLSVDAAESDGQIVLRNEFASISAQFSERCLERLNTTSGLAEANLHSFDYISLTSFA